MAEQEATKVEEKKDDGCKKEVNDAFNNIRELLNQREKSILTEIEKNTDSTATVKFDTEQIKKVIINSLFMLEISEQYSYNYHWIQAIEEFGTISFEEKKSDSTDSNNVGDGDVVSLESTIVNEKDEIAKLSKVLFEKLSSKSVKLKLLYTSSADGDTKEEFHSKCDDKGATLTLVQTEFGHVFGCYTSLSWSSVKSLYNSDDAAFIFLLRSSFGHDTPKIYTIENDKYKPKAVYHNLNYGPAFGHGQDIGIDPSGKSWIKSGYSYMLNGNALCGAQEFEDLNRKKRYFFKYTCYEVFALEKE